MKQKKPYIAPKIEIIPMEENLMDHASKVYVDFGDGTGEDIPIIEGDIPEEAKESPYSGAWEL